MKYNRIFFYNFNNCELENRSFSRGRFSVNTWLLSICFYNSLHVLVDEQQGCWRFQLRWIIIYYAYVWALKSRSLATTQRYRTSWEILGVARRIKNFFGEAEEDFKDEVSGSPLRPVGASLIEGLIDFTSKPFDANICGGDPPRWNFPRRESNCEREWDTPAAARVDKSADRMNRQKLRSGSP